jgi:mevalonate kinase
MKNTFYSNGKLLITGEYLVLDGAKALALPTKFGQDLLIENGSNKGISWKSYDHDGGLWFESNIDFVSIINKERFNDEEKVKNTLIEILHEAYLLNPSFINNANGYDIKTRLTFPKSWGLGTSSTLINNLSQWLAIDAHTLLKNSFGGSGYDIACAQNDTAILYQLVQEKPNVEIIHFDPKFANHIFFIYLNKKQSSKAAIHSYYNKQGNIAKSIPVINQITNNVIKATNLEEFALELQKHEIEMSQILEMQTVKEALFNDFDGIIKSLGAWGGDFIMAISKNNPEAYFKERGFEVVVPYSEMIL